MYTLSREYIKIDGHHTVSIKLYSLDSPTYLVQEKAKGEALPTNLLIVNRFEAEETRKKKGVIAVAITVPCRSSDIG
tara:strand:+ start:361 stop:591 length:231 start_codon:yes stop_codon:yes gene_type:complete